MGQLVAVVGHTFQSGTIAHESDKVQLAVICAGVAEDGDTVTFSLIIQVSGHQDLGLAGLDVELEEHAAGVITVILLPLVEHAVIHGINRGDCSFFRDSVLGHRPFDLRIGRQCAIHGAHVDPVAIGCCAVTVGLYAVAVAGLAYAVHIGGQGLVAQVIDHTVSRFGAVGCVGDFLEGIAVVCVAVLNVKRVGIGFCSKRCGDETHHQDETHDQG